MPETNQYNYEETNILEAILGWIFADQANGEMCLLRYFCSNGSMISIYAVLFTIIIGLVFYIYGIEKADQKWTVIEKTKVSKVVRDTIFFFILSFINLSTALYAILNLILVSLLLRKMLNAFLYITKFNAHNVSPKIETEKFKLSRITAELIKDQNEQRLATEINEAISNMPNIERLLSDEKEKEYQIIKATKNGYISGIEYRLLGGREVDSQNVPINRYYLPLHIYLGAKIAVGEPIFGIHNKNTDDIKDVISIADEESYKSRLFHLDEELKSRFNLIFEAIKSLNYKLVENEFEDAQKYIDLAFNMPENYSEGLLESIIREFLTPLQEASFETAHTGVIRAVTLFNHKYLYKSIYSESKVKFNIFMKGFEKAFWDSLQLQDKEARDKYQKMYIHWIYEILEYSLKPRLEKTNTCREITQMVFISLNRQLKLAYDKDDEGSIENILYLVSSTFSEKHLFNKTESVEALTSYKDALLFGFTACVYREAKNQKVSRSILERLLKEVDTISAGKGIEGLLHLCDSALAISEQSGMNLNWDNLSWSNQQVTLGIRSGSISTDSDITFLLIDRLYKHFRENTFEIVTVNSTINSELISIHKEHAEGLTVDKIYPFSLIDADFEITKKKVVEVFTLVKQNYDKKVEKELIQQPISDRKVDTFFESNIKAYTGSNLLNRLATKSQILADNDKAFGFNLLYYKQQFVEKTNLHLLDENTFGEGLAREENNRILERIIENSKSPIKEITTKELISTIHKNAGKFTHALIWSKGYINLLDFRHDEKFTPSWQIPDRESYGHNFQGKAGNVNVYKIFSNQKTDLDPYLLLVNKGSVNIEEFTPFEEPKESITSRNDDVNALHMNVNNLSVVEDEFLENLIIRNDSLAESSLRKQVILQFYKGSSYFSHDSENILIYKIKGS